MYDGTQVRYLLNDHLGSTSVTASTSATKVAELLYKAWGETRYSNGTTPTTHRFTGQQEESTIGLYFYHARWYDPTIGRFAQADTLVPQPGNPQSLNRYAYTLNNPQRYADPSGHAAETVVDIISIAADVAAVKQDPSVGNVTALVIDVGCALLPGVPAFAGVFIRGLKATDKALDVAKVLSKVEKAGQWVKKTESMSHKAREYQEFVTRAVDGRVFRLRGVDFDGFLNGRLLDAKGYYGQFVDRATGEFFDWFTKDGGQEMIKQARRQVAAADGAPIDWVFNESEALDAVRKLLRSANVEGINLVLKPME